MVVGDDGTNGGLWCSPRAKTSRPTSSAFCAMVVIALIRSASVGVRPVVGSGVTSPTVKIPNCITISSGSLAMRANEHDVSCIPGVVGVQPVQYPAGDLLQGEHLLRR